MTNSTITLDFNYINKGFGNLPQVHSYLVFTPDTSLVGQQELSSQQTIRGSSDSKNIINAQVFSLEQSPDYKDPDGGLPPITLFQGSSAEALQIWSGMVADVKSINTLGVYYHIFGPSCNSVTGTLILDAHNANPALQLVPSTLDDCVAPGININLHTAPTGKTLPYGSVASMLASCSYDATIGAAELQIELMPTNLDDLIRHLFDELPSLSSISTTLNSAYSAATAYIEGSDASEHVTEAAGLNGSSAYTFTQNGVISTATLAATTENLLSYQSATSQGLTYIESFNTNGTLHSYTLDQANGSSQVTTFNLPRVLDASLQSITVSDYSGANGTGNITETDFESESSSALTTYLGASYNNADTIQYSAPDEGGTVTGASASYQLEQPNGTITAQSYSSIAAALAMPGVTGTVLAALNDDAAPPVLVAGTGNATYTTSSADSVLAEQASVIVPLASTGPQAIFNAGGTPAGAFTMPVVPAAEQSAVAYAAIVNADARTVAFIAVSAAGDAADMVYVVDNADNLIDEIPDYAQNLTSGSSLSKQNTQFTGSGYPGMPAYLVAVGNTTIIPSGDFNGSSTTPHAAGDVVGDEVLSGSPYLSLAALNSGAQAASNVFDAGIDSGDDTPDYGYTIGVAAGGGAVITGNGGSGYGGTATLTDVDQVELGGVAYALATVAAGGGATGLTTAPTEPGAGPASSGTIVAEGAGAGSTITLAYDAPVYWHVNAGGDRITLDGAPGDEFYMAGASSQYTPVYNQAAGALDLYAGSGESGTPTVFTIAGTAGGEVNFTDGGVLGLGDVGDATEYVGLGGQANLEDDGNQTIWGGANAEAFFQDGDATPDGFGKVIHEKGGFFGRTTPYTWLSH